MSCCCCSRRFVPRPNEFFHEWQRVWSNFTQRSPYLRYLCGNPSRFQRLNRPQTVLVRVVPGWFARTSGFYWIHPGSGPPWSPQGVPKWSSSSAKARGCSALNLILPKPESSTTPRSASLIQKTTYHESWLGTSRQFFLFLYWFVPSIGAGGELAQGRQRQEGRRILDPLSRLELVMGPICQGEFRAAGLAREPPTTEGTGCGRTLSPPSKRVSPSFFVILLLNFPCVLFVFCCCLLQRRKRRRIGSLKGAEPPSASVGSGGGSEASVSDGDADSAALRSCSSGEDAGGDLAGTDDDDDAAAAAGGADGDADGHGPASGAAEEEEEEEEELYLAVPEPVRQLLEEDCFHIKHYSKVCTGFFFY